MAGRREWVSPKPGGPSESQQAQPPASPRKPPASEHRGAAAASPKAHPPLFVRLSDPMHPSLRTAEMACDRWVN